jgi:hypothetical protein
MQKLHFCFIVSAIFRIVAASTAASEESCTTGETPSYQEHDTEIRVVTGKGKMSKAVFLTTPLSPRSKSIRERRRKISLWQLPAEDLQNIINDISLHEHAKKRNSGNTMKSYRSKDDEGLQRTNSGKSKASSLSELSFSACYGDINNHNSYDDERFRKFVFPTKKRISSSSTSAETGCSAIDDEGGETVFRINKDANGDDDTDITSESSFSACQGFYDEYFTQTQSQNN